MHNTEDLPRAGSLLQQLSCRWRKGYVIRCGMVVLFTVTVFIGAALLFALQPMFARMVLPLLGGSPSVWNTAMVFYQAALLA